MASWGSGVALVAEALTYDVIKAGTRFGVTWSMKVKAGRRRTVLEVWPWIVGVSSGTGMLEAESIIFCTWASVSIGRI